MQNAAWIEVVERWRSLPNEEKQQRRLEAIPRHVANSMAMEGEPVDEEWIRQQLACTEAIASNFRPDCNKVEKKGTANTDIRNAPLER